MARKSSKSTHTRDKHSRPIKKVAKRGTSEPDDPSPNPGDSSEQQEAQERRAGEVDDIRRQLSRGG